jgi:hypothetical protein
MMVWAMEITSIMNLPTLERNVLLYKLMHLTLLHQAKENRNEIIKERLF